MTEPESHPAVTVSPRLLIAILLFVIPLSQIPLDVYTPAMPHMVIDLGSTTGAVQNTVTA